MLDTLSVAQELTAGGIDRDQAEVIANAMRKLAQQGDHVTGDQFKAGLAEVRTEIAALDTRLSTQIADLRTEQRTGIASVRTEIADLRTEQQTGIAGVRTEIAEVRTEISALETRLIRWMVGTVLATAALTFAVLRFVAE